MRLIQLRELKTGPSKILLWNLKQLQFGERFCGNSISSPFLIINFSPVIAFAFMDKPCYSCC